MSNKVNTNLNTDSITALVESDNFLSLDSNLQNKIIDAVHNDKEKDGGIMGKLLGSRLANLAIHAALILCLALIVVLVVDNLHSYCIGEGVNMDLAGVIIPVVSLSIGYIFGKGAG